ncbi:MAG: hypothetical protein PHT81_07005, partial [Endomicrobiaceae bacterium]|nr:hypothetical protein [Endomicrobiaceae bacterium]
IIVDITYSKFNLHMNFAQITGIIGQIQLLFLSNGILMRGGITIGNLYLNDIFVYGKGLSEAYFMESELAIYPRMILSSKLHKKIFNNDIRTIIFLINISYNIDFDGIYYLDFYRRATISQNKISKVTISTISSLLFKLKNKYNKQPKILQKLDWTIRYHNEFCQKYTNFYKYIIPLRNLSVYSEPK